MARQHEIRFYVVKENDDIDTDFVYNYKDVLDKFKRIEDVAVLKHSMTTDHHLSITFINFQGTILEKVKEHFQNEDKKIKYPLT